MTRIAFLDTETTGLHPICDEIWDFAAIVRQPDGSERTHQFFIEHHTERADELPEEFYRDYQKRYDARRAYSRAAAAAAIDVVLADRVHVVGAVPNFDTERIALLLRRHGYEPGWHYHLIDVENLAVGYLWGQHGWRPEHHPIKGDLRKLLTLPWDSEELSNLVGVDPGSFDRHTAMGDAEWARAIYDAVMGGPA